MASTFPGAIDSFTDPLSNSPLNSPSHSAQHADLNDAAEKIETFMGLVKVIPTGATGGTVSSTGTVTIGSAVSSVNITGCFSALYNSYEIIYSNGVASFGDLRISSPQSTGANYFSQGLQQTSGSATLTGIGNASSTFWVVGVLTNNSHGLRMTIHNPFVTKFTYFSSQMASDFSIFTAGGVNNTANSFTGIVLTPQTGTLTGGSVTIYGYRI